MYLNPANARLLVDEHVHDTMRLSSNVMWQLETLQVLDWPD